MKLSSAHLKRYRDIAGLLWKYGRSDLVQHIGMNDSFEVPMTVNSKEVTPEQLANDLEAMGPTYVKLGQVLAGRPDLLPKPYIVALSRLQDHVKPFSYAEVEEIVTRELGVRISSAFSTFNQEPIAAASLGQVHLAALRDGRPVAVKVQRPGIREKIANDFEVLSEIATLIDGHTEVGRRYRFLTVLDEFKTAIQNELNYEREAQNLITVGQNLAEFPLIQIPQPVPDYCTREVLTMDFVRGRKVTSLSPLARLELGNTPLTEELFKAYLKQVLVDGIFHADPHPGNVFVTDDGRIALLDLGMVGHTSPGMQETLLKLLLAISTGKGEEAAELAIRTSEKMENFDAPEFRRQINHLVALTRDAGLQQMKIGESLLDVSRAARDAGLFVPSELTLLGKTLLQLDEVGRILDPTFNPTGYIQQNVSELIRQRVKKDLSQASIFSSMLEVKDFASHLPSRLNRIMDALANAELEVKVKATDAGVIMDGMQKIANRIAMSIVLAGLLIGASLLMRVPTSFQIFGYPGLAMLFFLAAAGCGFWLVISIFVQDYKSRKKLE